MIQGCRHLSHNYNSVSSWLSLHLDCKPLETDCVLFILVSQHLTQEPSHGKCLGEVSDWLRRNHVSAFLRTRETGVSGSWRLASMILQQSSCCSPHCQPHSEEPRPSRWWGSSEMHHRCWGERILFCFPIWKLVMPKKGFIENLIFLTSLSLV